MSMKIIYKIGRVNQSFKKSVLTIGIFDGVHIGHKKLISKAVKRARHLKTKAVIMTFSPHPIHILHPELSLTFLTSLPYRLKLMEDLGIDACIIVRFTKQFSKLTPDKFIKHHLIKYLNPAEIFVGEDFRFGQSRQGGFDSFKEAGQKYGFKVKGVRPLIDDHKNKKISSTQIRHHIDKGKLKAAAAFLGRNVSIMGEVIKGDARGKTLGFPTANIFSHNEILPPIGVYASQIIIGKRIYRGMSNIGVRPSFNTQNTRINIEVHIFDFNKNLYGKNIIIEFIQKIRNEKIFPSKEKLILQLKKDEIKARNILRT